MNDLALYRRYRPQRFLDVRGQDEVINVLVRSIKDKSISHAYLFSGGRGTGKTTIARIFASEIGCTPTDLYEIDGASNRTIDDVRNLREAVSTMPFESPYKVYIIDEVHMLTKEAFNALLKTLEEPPQHVVFILATTDKEKVPETIISRCQSFTFKQPQLKELKEFVIDVAKKEDVVLDAPSAEIVAMFGDGSYRDTLSVLEKVLISARGSKKIESDLVAKIVGAPTHDLINRIIRSIADGDVADGISALREASANHVDMKVYMRMILAKLRAILFLRYAPNTEADLLLEFSPDDVSLIKKLALSEGREINSHVLQEFLSAGENIGYSTIPSLPLELVLVKLKEAREAKEKKVTSS